MVVKRSELANIIAKKTLVNDQPVTKLAAEIAAFVLSNQLTSQLDSIMRDVSTYRQQVGIIDVKVISAYPLSSDSIDSIKKIVTKYFDKIKSIVIEPVVDQSIIGGIKLEFPAQSLDLTVRAKLNQLLRLTTQERI